MNPNQSMIMNCGSLIARSKSFTIDDNDGVLPYIYNIYLCHTFLN